KAALVSTIQRALSICTDYARLNDEFNQIRPITRQNEYPRAFVDTTTGVGLNEWYQRQNEDLKVDAPVSGCEKKRMYMELPYVENPIKVFYKKIKHPAGKIRPDIDRDKSVYIKTSISVSNFFQTKDPVPKHLQSEIVYSAKCGNCNYNYVGKTERQKIMRT
ncbi:unnamed protein product, partial [Didymodactylos carnosus]